MYERENRTTISWRWWVLTEEGKPTDPSNPHLSPGDADLVFASLIQEGLLLPTIVTEQGILVGAHRINAAKEAEWKSVINPPGKVGSFLKSHSANFWWTIIGTAFGFFLGKVFP
jgi:hypothetical protein